MRSYNSRFPLFLSYRTERPIAHDFPAHGPIGLRWASGTFGWMIASQEA
jgi:hypothetical protein